MITNYRNGLPWSRQGLGVESNHYVSGRIAVSVAAHGGLTGIFYLGHQPLEKSALLQAPETSAFSKLGRMQAVIDGEPYFLEFNNTFHYPSGYSSECELDTVKIRHELVLDRNSVFQRIRIVSNPQRRKVGARLLIHGHLWVKEAERRIEQWKTGADNSLHASVTDAGTELKIKLGCTVPCTTSSRHEPFKFYMETAKDAEEYSFYFAFDSDGENTTERISSVFRETDRLLAEGPRFETGNPAVDSALNNAAPMLNALAVHDHPGAVRASQHYWIWGWDSMVHAEAYLWSGNCGIIRDMLDFYRETADPEHGIGHAFTTEFAPFILMPPCSQGLYIVLLYNYFAATGDLETVKRNYEFAGLLLDRAGKSRQAAGSLGTGIGFFPDLPQLLEQKAEDISLINNSLYLQALRAVAGLERFVNPPEAEKHEAYADALQNEMERLLWNSDAGYWTDSADGNTLAQRRYYPLYGQLYVSPFGTLPQENKCRETARFMKRNFLFKHGLYMFPRKNAAFMADGNQLGAYYPPVDRYYWNIMNRTGDADSAADFERIVEFFWSTHTYPEGLTHETANDDPTVDNPGGKQAFTMKAWFCDALELNLGLRVSIDGFTLNPLPVKRPFRVYNLVFRGKSVSFERTGNGRILLNGEPVRSDKITWDMLKSNNLIRISAPEE